MPVTDAELARMERNLSSAFQDAVQNYEHVKADSYYMTDNLKAAGQNLAMISQAYLAVSREQEERARRRREEEERKLPAKAALRMPPANP